MKSSPSSITRSLLEVSLLTISLACVACPLLAADYNPYPKAGVYDASDSSFERVLTVKANGKFTLEVAEKGKPGNLRSGAGEGKLADAPGGWDFSEGRCTMSLKRAAGGMQLHVEACASAWGDVPFDGKYKYQGDEVAAAATSAVKAAPAPKASVASAPAALPASDALPTRGELIANWTNIANNSIAGKSVRVMVKSLGGTSPDNTLENYSHAAFVIDSADNYQKLSAAEKAKPPLKLINIPLPAIKTTEGLEFEIECSYGKANNVIAMNIASAPKGKPMTRKRTSAWMLDSNLQLIEVKPANKVKCPTQPGY